MMKLKAILYSLYQKALNIPDLFQYSTVTKVKHIIAYRFKTVGLLY